MADSQQVQSSVPHDRRKGNSRRLTQAYDLRDALATKALELLALVPPDDLDKRARLAVAATSLVKAWEAACDRIRIARGQPLPGSRRPASKPSRPARRQSGLAVQPKQPGLTADQPPRLDSGKNGGS